MSRNVTDHHIISSHTAVCLRFWKIGQWLNAGLVVSDWRWTQRSSTNWHRLVTPTYRRCKLPERTENHGHGPSEHHREFLSYPRTKASEWVDQLHSPSLPLKCENRSEFEQQIRQRTHTHSWQSRRLRSETGSVFWPMKCTHLERELPLFLFIDYSATYCQSLFKFFKIFSYVKFTSLCLIPSCIFLHLVVFFIPSSSSLFLIAMITADAENQIQTHERY